MAQSRKKLRSRNRSVLGNIAESLSFDNRLDAYIAQLEALAPKDKKDDDERSRHQFVLEHLYMNLSVLDEKTGSTIEFAAAVVGVYSAVIGYLTITLHQPIVPSFCDTMLWALLGAALSYMGAISLVSVHTVHWSSTKDLKNYNANAKRLLRTRGRRTMRFRVGWFLTIVSSAMLAIIVVVIGVKYTGTFNLPK